MTEQIKDEEKKHEVKNDVKNEVVKSQHVIEIETEIEILRLMYGE